MVIPPIARTGTRTARTTPVRPFVPGELLTCWLRPSGKYGACNQIARFHRRPWPLPWHHATDRPTTNPAGTIERTRGRRQSNQPRRSDAARTARNSDIHDRSLTKTRVDDAFSNLDDSCHQIDERRRLEIAFADLDDVDARVYRLPAQLDEPFTTAVASCRFRSGVDGRSRGREPVV